MSITPVVSGGNGIHRNLIPHLLTEFPNNVMIFGRLVERHIGDAGATP
jgi:hypothetical protein